jgi:hypothetical protein
MARNASEMAEILINLYRSNSGKNKGKYLLSKDEFKHIAGKETLKEAYVFEVDSLLREDGFVLINLRNERDSIAILSIITIINKFQTISEELCQEYTYFEETVDEW